MDLSKEYAKFLETGELYDTEILIGREPNTRVFRLHSLILKLRSPYFRTALSNNWVKIEDNIIKFQKQNISIEIFDIIIRYLYSGEIYLENDVKNNVELLIAADELCLNDLCGYIEDHLLKDQASLRCNFVLIRHVASQFNHFAALLQFYEEAFEQDPSLIFRANDFTEVDQEFLLDLLTKNNLSLKPIEIWDKLMEWCIAQLDELPSDITTWTADNVSSFGDLIHPFIPHINFKVIGSLDFFRKIRPFKNIFDNDFYIHIRPLRLEEIDSKILDLDSAFLIASWIKLMKMHRRGATYAFKLLVRGSKNGFETGTFHKYCDEKGSSTITVTRVKNTGEILGGFNPFKWKSEIGCYKFTKKSFIFSLDIVNLENSIFSEVVDGLQAIYNPSSNDNWGPDFGSDNSDLRLLVNSTNQGQCYNNSYERLIRKHEGRFEIDEYEVFQVIKRRKKD